MSTQMVIAFLLRSAIATTTFAPRLLVSTTTEYFYDLDATKPSELGTYSPDIGSPASTSSSSSLPVGAWVGIGFAICIVLVLIVFFFVGHRRVREYYVSLMQTRGKIRPAVAPKQVDVLTLDSIDIRCSTRSDNGRVSSGYDHAFSPRTSDLPFAPIDVELDGRLSPKLPILSKRDGSASGTPSSIRGGV